MSAAADHGTAWGAEMSNAPRAGRSLKPRQLAARGEESCMKTILADEP
jgi:hypothetical protein